MSENKNHIVALDGIRGLAILLVFILHTITLPDGGYKTALHAIALGHYGVDVCLSIGPPNTGILYRSKELPNYVWPLLILWLSPKRLLGAVGIISVLVFALRTLMLHHGFSGYVVSTFTLCWIDSFAIGGAANKLLSLPKSKHSLVVIAPLAVGPMLAIFIAIQFRLSDTGVIAFSYTVLAVVLSLVIVCATLFAESKWVAIFRSRPMTFLGKYSYSLYVFHFPIQISTARRLPLERIMHIVHIPSPPQLSVRPSSAPCRLV